MKNVIAIFKGDLHKIRRNLIAWVIILGLIVVPPLYAWFNISACWDPYGNTRELKIALANNDKGYDGQLIPMSVNLGENLVAKVTGNDKFDWVITDAESAIEGTKSGEYYAAVVVPESFSSDMLSFFDSDVNPSQLIYYVNEKENAIASKITQKGATAIQQEVENNFTKEIMSIALNTAKALTDNGDMTTATQLMGDMMVSVRHVQDIVNAANSSVVSLSASVKSMENMLKSTKELADTIREITASGRELSDDADKNINKVIGDIDAEVQLIDQFLKEAQEAGVPGLEDIIAKVTALKADLEALKSELTSLKKDSDSALDDMDKIAGNIEKISRDTLSSLGVLRKALDNTAPMLKDTATRLGNMAEELEEGKNTGDTDVLKNVLHQNATKLSGFIAAPVELNRIPVYHVENYGSSMAPFYTSLAIWVGATILVALMSVALEESRRKELYKLREHQVYLGRYILLALIGLAQALLICLGDLFFLGIQCAHPLLFVLAGLVTAIVFGNIIYTLTASFGDIGKAVAVIIMVIQVAGSGGTFPVEMTPEFFQILYPLMPFNHSMAAMREAIAGMYGNTYWSELGTLLIFMSISLIVGIVLQKPLRRGKIAFEESLEKTKLM
ncbi:MAG: YhgE/Pip domain-containing protein [Firmicutes bacterium]|nr:YhgE/Pip domain-containing protein [Bacillota bacterium]